MPNTPSVDGTTIPAAQQIIDGGGNVWNVSAGVYENGVTVTPTPVTLLMYDNNTVYQKDGAGIWWSWTGATWTLSSNPALVPSLTGTSIPNARQIIDDVGNIWVVSNGVYENGASVTPTPVTALLYDNGIVYQLDTAGIWWAWNRRQWVFSGNPTAVPSPNGTTIPSAAQITDGGGNVWAVVGGVVYENGAAAGFSDGVTVLSYVSNAVYQEDSSGWWSSWNGNTWVPSGNPAGGSAGSATLSWTAPTQNTDGTPLTNLAGFTVYYGLSPTALTQVVQLADPTATSYVVPNLDSATYYFAVAAYSSAGREGANSAEVSATIQPTPGG